MVNKIVFLSVIKLYYTLAIHVLLYNKVEPTDYYFVKALDKSKRYSVS